jgi:CheY-like chemotaxis protein/signal transduction histidine kinase/chemotaxis signal transduction protein
VISDQLTALFQSQARATTGTLRALLVQALRNADDELLWIRLSRMLEALAADALAAGNTPVSELSTAMNQIPAGLMEGRFSFGPLYVKLLMLLIEHLEEFLGPTTETATLRLATLCNLCNRAYNRESFSLKGFSLMEMQQQRKAPDATKVDEKVDESVQVSLDTVERLGEQLNSVIVHQFQLKKNGDGLSHIEDAVRELLHGLSGADPGPKNLQRAETILKDLQTLGTGLKEDLLAVDRSSFGLQEEIARLRMLPFHVIGERLATHARKRAQSEGKVVELSLQGQATLLDKSILELVYLPLSELVSNAVTHGIGSSPEGKVSLECSSDGTSIRIAVIDHGPGIDFEALRSSAAVAFPLERDEILAMAAEQLTRFLFEPGLGSSVGLSGVKEALDAMQGKISIDSHQGMGTTIVLQIPASVSLVSGFFVRAGGERFFIPAVYVREVVIFQRSDLVSLPGGPVYPLRQEMVPVVPLASVFEGKEALRKDVEQMAIISLLGETWGLILDTIVRHATLGYKPLPDNLSSLREVQGLVYDEKFNLVPILSIPAIIIQIRRLRSIEFRQRYHKADVSGRNILLVDDSLVSRQTLGRILADGGFTVEVAEDGIAALELLHHKFFHLVISDDEMPRMDGLTLVENLRKEPEYVEVPVIILIAERGGNAESQFRKVGIKDFYQKSDFDRHALLRDIQRLLAGA